MPDTKDFPLHVRKRRNGDLQLVTDTFPPRHEFSQEWLLENMKWIDMDAEQIVLRCVNGTGTYRIAREMMEGQVPDVDAEGKQKVVDGVPQTRLAKLSTGYWGILEDAEYYEWTPEYVPAEEASDG